MPEDRQLGGHFRFGVFEVDLRAGELRKYGMRIRLQGQPFQVLALLTGRPGDVVTRDELQKQLWPADTFVDFEHGLNKAINKLRDALGDSAENPRFVETVARRGYRFLAEVRTLDRSPLTTANHAVALDLISERERVVTCKPVIHDRLLARFALTISPAVAVVLFIGGLAVWRSHPQQPSSTVIRSLAVLPFESLSNESSQDYFADGMTDQLISDLGQIGALRVISRTSAMGYKHVRKPLPQIARELNVDAVVEGTVLQSGDRVRITAQLISAAADQHLWSQSYEGELGKTLELQNKVAMAIAEEVRINLNSQEKAALSTSRVIKPKAYVSYLKGRYFWNRRTPDSLKTALEYFNQAIEEDPQYSQAYSGLADTYALLGDWQYGVMTPKEALPKAKAAAMKAVELDESLGEAHNSLAFCLRSFDWNLDAAGKEFQRAIELNPGYATAHHWYAWHLAILHRYDEALVEMRKAQSLDPLSLIINADLAELLAISHSYDESIRQSQKTLELDPNFGLTHNHLGQVYLQTGKYGEAVAELKIAVKLSDGSPTCVANLARAYVASGDRGNALKLLTDLKNRSNGNYSHGSEIAIVYASLGDADQAIYWLERAYVERFNPGVLLRSGFDPLRSDSRFKDLLRRVGLPN